MGIMLRNFLIPCILCLISYSGFSQTDSSHLRVSLLTCSPGDELYTTFGHSALRITDSLHNDDIVYNYGTFNFDEPGFYTKFIRGKLMYYLSTEDFTSFKHDYEADKRTMTEQVLNLSFTEKEKIFSLLMQNLQSENRFYKYDFLFDNCTTRLRDLLENAADTTVQYANILKEKTRFRQLIHAYLDKGDKQWGKLGIDLLLGAKTDAVMDNREAMFLPDYLLKGVDSARIGVKHVVRSKYDLMFYGEENGTKNFFTDPVFIFSVLFIGIVVISFSKNTRLRGILNRFDGFLFFMTGFTGIVIFFMWFGTDHITTKNNYNLLWAWPTHAVAAFFVDSKKAWTKYYFTFTVVANLLVLMLWFFVPQQLNPAFIPIVLLIIFRSTSYARQPVHTI